MGLNHICYDGLKVTVSDSGVRTILLDRPKRNNALTIQMMEYITHIINEASKDGDKTKLIYITGGNGNYFSSGNDLKNYFPKEDIDPVVLLESATKTFQEFVKSLINCPKIVVVGVNGHAIGVAVTMLGLVDVVYTSDRATFVTPFSSLGLVAEACSTHTFPRLMGRPKAMEMLCFGRKIDAYEAKERNLVSCIYPHETFQTNVQRVLEEVIENSYIGSFKSIKKLVSTGASLDLLHSANEKEVEELRIRMQSPDCIDAALKVLTKSRKTISKL